MNAIVPVPATPATVEFEFEGHTFRATDLAGEPIFRATDVATILSYRDAANMTRLLDDDETTTQIVRGGFGEAREATYLTEPGLIHAILNRRASKGMPATTKEFVTRFQRWVRHEVIPSIRRTGSYSIRPTAIPVDPFAVLLENPQKLIEVAAHYAQAALVEKAAHAETRIQLEDTTRLVAVHADRADHAGRALVVAQERIEAERPLVEGYRQILDAGGALAITDAANVLGVRRGRLFAMMRDRGTDEAPRRPWLYCRPGSDVERAFGERIQRGELRHRAVRIERSSGPEVRDQVLVTARGLDRLRVEYPAWEADQRRLPNPGLFDNPADAA